MFDTSTLNQAELAKFPAYKCPPSYRIDNHLGAGCAGDPPGFPTYFLCSVYTQYGNTPPKGPDHVILDDGGTFRRVPEHGWSGTRGEASERWNKLMRRLWKSLPYNHPRVVAWIRDTYHHMAHCYKDVDSLFPSEYGQPAMLIFPVPSYRLREFRNDPRFSDEWQAKETAAIEQQNAETQAKYAAACRPETHSAYLAVHRYYHEHTPDLALIANSPKEYAGHWWETETEQPTPKTCTGGVVQGKKLYRGISGSPGFNGHPLNGSWCQWCGWKES